MMGTTGTVVGLVFMALAVGAASAQTPDAAHLRSVATTHSTAGQDSTLTRAADSSSQPDSSTASAMDADLADRVRRIIAADRNLSAHAAKISIVSTNGEIRLSGLVQNEGEKTQIASKAKAVARHRPVVNDLRVMVNAPDGAALRALLEQASIPRTPVVAAN